MAPQSNAEIWKPVLDDVPPEDRQIILHHGNVLREIPRRYSAVNCTYARAPGSETTWDTSLLRVTSMTYISVFSAKNAAGSRPVLNYAEISIHVWRWYAFVGPVALDQHPQLGENTYQLRSIRPPWRRNSSKYPTHVICFSEPEEKKELAQNLKGQREKTIKGMSPVLQLATIERDPQSVLEVGNGIANILEPHRHL
ncbi:hypothetical protein C8R44DRAFT_729158 [Mycena epipterygia]|nr:hypothetical protein C8R44DRAFT_729158 [Mycena epipterygia]